MTENLVTKAMWTSHFEPLPPKTTLDVPSNRQTPILELKQLYADLKYVYLGESSTFPMIISLTLELEQTNRLIKLLQ